MFFLFLPIIEGIVDDLTREFGRKLNIGEGFAGTGIVSRLFKTKGNVLYVNDIAGYSETLNTCYLSNIDKVYYSKIKTALSQINRLVNIGKNINYTPWISKHWSPEDDNNIKEIKLEIRSNMRKQYQDDYPSGIIENIILDLFQDSKDNIEKVVNEINFIQDKNYMELELPIINDSLNLNISNCNGYIIINHIKDTLESNLIEIYKNVVCYKFIYSINNKILDDFNEDEKINIIKTEIKNTTSIKLGVYYLKNNKETL